MAPPKKKLKSKKCKVCGEVFHQKRYSRGPDGQFKNRKYCSKRCVGKALTVDVPARVRLRIEVIEAYGGKCKCCGEDKIEFLSLDHVNNDGAEHRKQIGQGRIYQWAKVNDYPDLLQVLCYNCNMAKGFYGKCPHEIS